MKGKKIFRLVMVTLLILFATLYFTQAAGYFEYTTRRTNTLTEDAITRFEEDIKSGKKIKAKEYIKKENNYHNNLSRLGSGVSSAIESSFQHIMNFIFKEINNAVNSD